MPMTMPMPMPPPPPPPKSLPVFRLLIFVMVTTSANVWPGMYSVYQVIIMPAMTFWGPLLDNQPLAERLGNASQRDLRVRAHCHHPCLMLLRDPFLSSSVRKTEEEQGEERKKNLPEKKGGK